MDVIKGAVPLINVGEGSAFAAAASMAAAVGAVVAAAALLGLALSLVRAMTDAGDERARAERAKDAARIPLSVLAIGFVLCAGSGIYLAVNANAAEDGIKSQAAEAVEDYSTNPGSGGESEKLADNAFVPSNPGWKTSLSTSSKGKDASGNWNWANNPSYPQYDYSQLLGDSFKGGHYEIDGTYVYTFGSGEGSKPTTMRIPLPSEFK